LNFPQHFLSATWWLWVKSRGDGLHAKSVKTMADFMISNNYFFEFVGEASDQKSSVNH